MNSNKLAILFLLCLLFNVHCSLSKAQTLTWSVSQKVVERAMTTEVIGQNDHGLFIIKKSYREENRNIFIEHYTPDLKRTVSKIFFTHRGEYFAQANLTPNFLLLFYAAITKDNKNLELRVRRLDYGLNQVGNDTSLISIPRNDITTRFLQVFKQKFSEDILFLYTLQENEIPTQLEYLVIDSNLSVRHAGSYRVDMPVKYEIEQAVFTKDNVAILLHTEVKKKVSRTGYRYYILDGSLSEESLTRTSLYNDSSDVTEGLLKADIHSHALVFAGLYSLKDSGFSKGYYIWRREETGRRLQTFYHPFPQRTVEEMSGKNSRFQGINNLRVGDIVLRHDGGVILTCEQYQETRETLMEMNVYGMAPQTNFRYYYYYEDMLVLSLNPNGGADWSTVVKKEQVSVNDNGVYSSYILTALPDRLAYIYNDLSRKNWSLNLVEINEKGVIKNSLLIRSQDYEGKLIPQYGDQIAFNEVLIPALDRKGQSFLRVKFDFPMSSNW